MTKIAVLRDTGVGFWWFWVLVYWNFFSFGGYFRGNIGMEWLRFITAS